LESFEDNMEIKRFLESVNEFSSIHIDIENDHENDNKSSKTVNIED
jgi:hypothetical protein